MMRRVLNVFIRWLPFAVLSVGLCVLVYAAVQQALRHGANDPQIQLAEDAAYALAQGTAVEAVVPAAQIDVGRSLAPFLIVYDARGQVVRTSGLLQGQTPALPPGVLDYVRDHGQDRVTWEPRPGVRIAAVVVGYGGSGRGTVLAGRSLREVEKRESQVQAIVGLALLAILGGTLATVALGELVGAHKTVKSG